MDDLYLSVGPIIPISGENSSVHLLGENKREFVKHAQLTLILDAKLGKSPVQGNCPTLPQEFFFGLYRYAPFSDQLIFL